MAVLSCLTVMFLFCSSCLAIEPRIEQSSFKSDRPNVLLLMADQMRNDMLGSSGNKITHTPNLALLASDGSWSSNMMLIRNRGTTNLTNKLDIHSGGMITGSNPAVLNSWAIDSFTRGDVASTWGSTGTLFHNGSTDGSGSLGGSASVSLANFNVGSWNTGAYMDGDIAELIIYQ